MEIYCALSLIVLSVFVLNSLKEDTELNERLVVLSVLLCVISGLYLFYNVFELFLS